MSIASFGERFIDFRSCWVVFIHVVCGCPGGLLQFSKGEAVNADVNSIILIYGFIINNMLMKC